MKRRDGALEPGPSAGGRQRPVPPPAKIDAEFEKRTTLQSYASRPAIEGVVLHDLRRFVDDGGSFSEVARLAGGHLPLAEGFEVRQINYAVMEPGTIKAFHLHLHQSEFWFVPPECRLLMGLLDTRPDSSSRRVAMRLVLGAGQSRLLFIPAGVAHGAANLSARMAQIFYVTNRLFDPSPQRCDERRLPWDTLGAEFWQQERG